MKKWLRWVLWTVIGLPLAVLIYWVAAQLLIGHDDSTFTPDYEKIQLTGETSAETVFLQTGLSPAAAETVLAEQGLEGLQMYQDAFFAPKQTECTPIFGIFIREDKQLSPLPPELTGVEPGDILLSLSAHSAGWRHGHAALVVSRDRVLQLAVIGTDSALFETQSWRNFSQYAVLRLKDRTPELQAQLLAYADDHLMGVPYSLGSAFLGPKAPEDDGELRMMCTSLVWYGYYQLGYDLDSDGGRIVTTRDMLDSPYLEVVQVYGMDPREFADRMA